MDTSTKNSNLVKSFMLKAGKRTYFFDVKNASNDKKYLRITESSFEGEGKPRKYNSFILFPEQVPTFKDRLAESISYLR